MIEDKSVSSQPVEFVRWDGGENKLLVGNRVQLEDESGNPLNLSAGLPIVSAGMIALLTQIVALLTGTLTTSGSLQPNVFKPLSALDISSEATIWDPTAGTKFRLMGGLLSVTGAAGNVAIKDGNSGATIFNVPNAVVGTALAFNLGDGILSGTADNNLRVLGAALQILNGTIWGREA